MTVAVDAELSGFWGTVYALLGGRLEGKLTPQYLDYLAGDGSAIAQYSVADERNVGIDLANISQTDFALFEKSAAGGYKPALQMLARIQLMRDLDAP
jgi:hypothetical protein